MYHRPRRDFGGGAEDVHHGMYLVVFDLNPLPIPHEVRVDSIITSNLSGPTVANEAATATLSPVGNV